MPKTKIKPRNKTFVKVTNNEIYKEIKSLHAKVDKINGKTKVNRIIGLGGIGLGMFVLGWLIRLAIKGGG